MSNTGDLTACQIFEELLPEKLKSNEKAKEINASYLFKIEGENGGVWTVDLNNKTGNPVSEGEVGTPDCTLTMQADNFVKLWNGELNGMKAMMTGKLHIRGNMALATKLQAFIGA